MPGNVFFLVTCSIIFTKNKGGSMKKLLMKYQKIWYALLYVAFYLPCFFFLENRHVESFHIMHSVLDDKIPFVEIFAIPYYLWFPFVIVTYFYLAGHDLNSYKKACAFMFIGMTASLIIYYIYPTSQDLRPDLSTIGRSNICITLMKRMYSGDTPTNVNPSLHVYNSIACAIALWRSNVLKTAKHANFWRYGAAIMAILISASTVLVKQHSIIDVFWGTAFALFMFIAIYVVYEKYFEKKSSRQVALD
jgi:membrane-associated phospholipid phosphatase